MIYLRNATRCCMRKDHRKPKRNILEKLFRKECGEEVQGLFSESQETKQRNQKRKYAIKQILLTDPNNPLVPINNEPSYMDRLAFNKLPLSPRYAENTEDIKEQILSTESEHLGEKPCYNSNPLEDTGMHIVSHPDEVYSHVAD